MCLDGPLPGVALCAAGHGLCAPCATTEVKEQLRQVVLGVVAAEHVSVLCPSCVSAPPGAASPHVGELPPSWIVPSAVQALLEWGTRQADAAAPRVTEGEMSAWELCIAARVMFSPVVEPETPAVFHGGDALVAAGSRPSSPDKGGGAGGGGGGGPRSSSPTHTVSLRVLRCPKPPCAATLAVDSSDTPAWLQCSCGESLCGCCGLPWVAVVDGDAVTHTAFASCAAFRAVCEPGGGGGGGGGGSRASREAVEVEQLGGKGRGKTCPRCRLVWSRGRGHMCHNAQCPRCQCKFRREPPLRTKNPAPKKP